MGRNREPQRIQSLPVDREALRMIITTDDPQRLVKVAEDLAEHLVKIELATSQIRNIFGTARRLQTDWLRPPLGDDEKRRAARRQLVLLKPKLAYQSQRMPPVGPLADWLSAGIDYVVAGGNELEEERELQEYRRFTRFMDFFEAVLAFHTAKGGKQEQRSSRG